MEDLTGKKFNRLTVLGFAGRRGNNYYWECQCDCGNIRQVQAQGLRRGSTKSCGCYNREIITKHGLDGDKLYHVFNSMRNRCYSVNNNSYHNYGGRGIAICDEWLNDVTVFIEWAHNNGYAEGLTIDRIDVNGNYEPSNCRWITKKEQSRNLRRNTKLTLNGRTQLLCEWSEETGIKASTLCYRLYKLGWSVEKALTTPVRGTKVKCND